MRLGTGAFGLVFAVLATGCGVDLGFAAGRAYPQKSTTAAGHIAVSSKLASPVNSEGVLVGAEVEGRAEEDLGSRWTTGARVGYGSSSDQRPGAVGWEVHADIGAVMRDGRLLHRNDHYLGATAAFTVWLTKRHELQDLNSATWLGVRALELVPFTRVRRYVDHPDDGPTVVRWDLGIGAAIRLRTVSDLL